MSKSIAVVLLLVLVATPFATAAVYAPVSSSSQGQFQHIVIIMQENHTFDNFFGTFPGANGIQNDPSGVQPFQITGQITKDLCHSVACAHTSFDNGKMDGFPKGENTSMTFGYYPKSAIQYYWGLASNYTLFDNFFSSVLGPSLPNHIALLQGNSGGAVSNELITIKSDPIMTELDQGGPWKYYAGFAPGYWMGTPFLVIHNTILRDGTTSLSAPTCSPETSSTGTCLRSPGVMPPNDTSSDHPPYPLANGQRWVQSVISEFKQSKYWSSTAIFLTWDDYGGWYDHVAPPQNSKTGDGFRVPLILVSPLAKSGYVDHTLGDFSSILRFIETTFNLPSLGHSDATANNLADGLKLGPQVYGQALTLTNISFKPEASQSVLNLTYSNEFFMNIRGNVTAVVSQSGVPGAVAEATSLISVNPTKTQVVSLVLPDFSPSQGNYTLSVSVVDPGGAVASWAYSLYLGNSTAGIGSGTTSVNGTSDS